MVNKELIQEAQKIMLDKLKEMSELDFDNFYEDVGAYNGCCSVMCEICKTLIELQGHLDE